jgi:endonuclease/exonuclease/phosphatase family metal-dependent hydrolase
MGPVVFSGRLFRACVAVVAALACLHLTVASAAPLRVVTYNILADSGGYTTMRPGFTTVIQGIGNETVNGVAETIDILTLQETTSNTTTVGPIVTALNNIYGAGTYAMSPYQATQSGSPSSGNGPNAMVYKTTTLQLIASVGIGTPSSSGAPRQPVRYQFRPVGGSASDDFYVYCSHCKSGTGGTNENRRNIEAQLLRTNAATLPSTVRILYTGDLNLTRSSEACFQTLAAAGLGQAFDPPNRLGDWDSNAAFIDVMTYGSTGLRYRDDFILITANVQNDPSGLQYVAGSYHTFAINGSTPLNGAVNSPSNTAFPSLPNRAAVLAALPTASDHLPVVADFNLPSGAQAPGITGQPINQTACSGSSTSFTITASGSPAPTYQWRKGTTNLTNGGNISGATSATLTINPVAGADAAADYNCVAANASGSATSNNASLTANVGPTFTAQPTNQAACSGSNASFTVSAGGSPAPTYQWRKGTTNLTNGGNISGATSAGLIINPAGSGDAAANYNCVITNSCGSATSNNVSLTVNAGPSITTQPAGRALIIGGTASFTVGASGSPAPSYHWRKNAVPLSDGGSVSGSETATLTINPVAAGDQGNYDVLITNTCGNVTSARAPFWLRGDLNCDGLVNGLDISSFVLALLDPAAYAAQYPDCSTFNADFSGDGSVTSLDIDAFVAALLGG